MASRRRITSSFPAKISGKAISKKKLFERIQIMIDVKLEFASQKYLNHQWGNPSACTFGFISIPKGI